MIAQRNRFNFKVRRSRSILLLLQTVSIFTGEKNRSKKVSNSIEEGRKHIDWETAAGGASGRA